ncbi:guanylate kinase [Hyphomonas sp. WL0036]|uniref:guanylate kinase n=1 Tax=Hyphomonas sediminis TaxID=2866160 RepID=UPI001C80B54D|nr:guanylate kinase [Hyphomonas sediminis]MBY9067088.1 guanylate kinase [Hyphomonas sediminis]
MSNSGHPKDTGRRRGLMLVLSSPSGAGKTTLSRKLLEEFNDVKLSVSATTRPPRPNEIDGKDYFFKSVDDFRGMIDRREFLEWAHVFDKYYGTPKADTVARLDAGEDVLFDVDWQGADALHDQMPNDVVSVFILPPSIEALKDRLMGREGSTPDMVSRRMEDAKREIMHWRRYDYVIVNDQLEVAYQRLKRILLVERLKRLRQLDLEHHVRALLGELDPA